ncbi:thiamine pyrophosphate-dependent enzyme [Sulfobacillus sp. hq2]|uniref:thiamine pyrophosphate-dependent enzyme n=1 Tax=Sulfobacillus TaxID=28033 RepID=UPI000CD2FA87|nr:thiamine pyrophosphate-dependent enzyme [Sulfobacillus sp. hq2]POB09872.1 pyruvate dehydrogenase (acetyl-transferring) E1 component subunit alpha [Sulfobacillus sp. hq2]
MESEQLQQFLYDMLLARAFEERAAEEYTQGHIAGFLHLYPGEEAVAVGTIRAAEPSDYIVSTYREHVHALIRDIEPKKIMAELYGKRTGISRGMGGSMHLFDKEHRFMGGYAIVGETFPIATGIGYAIAYRHLPEAVLCYFGDGAVNQGTFHESLNMAALWKLPILFICENNHYQIGTEIHRHSAVVDVYKRAASYAIPAEQVDGMNVEDVYHHTKSALAHIRAGGGPYLLEFQTYRYRGHSMADPGTYRPPAEVRAYSGLDPIVLATRELTRHTHLASATPPFDTDVIQQHIEQGYQAGHWQVADVETMKAQIQQILDDAVAFAQSSPSLTMDEAIQLVNQNHAHEGLI